MDLYVFSDTNPEFADRRFERLMTKTDGRSRAGICVPKHQSASPSSTLLSPPSIACRRRSVIIDGSERTLGQSIMRGRIKPLSLRIKLPITIAGKR